MILAAELEEMDAREVLRLSGAIHRGIVEREAYTLVLAAHWADRHCPDSVDERVVDRDGDGKVIPGTERSFLFGGEGTPQVLEFAPIEFGNSMAMSAGQGRALIADALDLRHRFPRLWSRTCLGEVPAWKARKVAATARHLSQEAAGLVDDDVVEVITAKAWSPFLTILAGRIIAADPEAAQERAERAAKRRFVETSPSNEYGLKGIHAQAEAGDVLRFKAQVDRLAKILTAHGDTESADVRRSKAMMILANPVLAAALIASSEGVDMAEFDIEDDDLDGIVGRDRDGWHIPNYRPDRKSATDPDTPPDDPDHDPPPPDDPDNPASPAERAEHASRSGHPGAFRRPPARTLDRPLFGSGGISADLEHFCIHQQEDSAPSSASATKSTDPGVRGQDQQHDRPDQQDPDSELAPESGHRTPPQPRQRENSAHAQSRNAEPGPAENSAQDQKPQHPGSDPAEISAHGQGRNVHAAPDELDGPVEPASDDGLPPPELDEPGKTPRITGIGAAKAMLETIARTGINVSKIGPTIILYHHYAHETLTDGNGVVRVDDLGPTTLQQMKNFLSPFTRIIIKPVIDLNTD